MPGRLEDIVRAFLREDLGVDDVEVGPDTALVSTGLVDSAGLVRLVAMLETDTGIAIPDRDITAENFDTLARIAAYLRQRGLEA
jgi:acyl carrier protein